MDSVKTTSSTEEVLKERTTEKELIENREKRAEEVRTLNLLSNTFMSVALNDKPAC